MSKDMQPMRDTQPPAQSQGEGIVASPRRPREETARLGKELYERDIRSQVEADHQGRSSRSTSTAHPYRQSIWVA